MPQTYISTAEAAELLGVSRMTITRWVHSGTLAAMQVGRAFQVERASAENLKGRLADLEAWADGPRP